MSGARQVFAMKSISMAHSMQQSSDDQLWFGIFTFDCLQMHRRCSGALRSEWLPDKVVV